MNPQHATVPLKRIFDLITDGTHFSPGTVLQDGMPYVTVRDIVAGQVDVERAARISVADFERLEKEGCRPRINDLLFSKDGTIGKVALCNRDDFVVLSSLAMLRPAAGHDPRYIKYVLLSDALLRQVEAQMAGAALRRITLDKIEELRSPVPPSNSTQICIANFLDEQTANIDALIDEKQSLLDTLSHATRAYAFALATGTVDACAERTARPEAWLGHLPRHWAVPKLGYLAEVGNGSTPRREVDRYWVDGTVPWITSTAIHDGVIESTEEYITETAIAESHLRMVRPGSTIVGLIGQGPTRGMAAILAIPATLSQNVAYASLRPGVEVEDEYLTMALTGMYSALRFLSDGVGGAQGAMNCETLRSFRLPIPPTKSEQRQLVDEYKHRNRAIADLQAHAATHIERLREYRSSLITAAVTGQLDINNFRAH